MNITPDNQHDDTFAQGEFLGRALYWIMVAIYRLVMFAAAISILLGGWPCN